MNFIIYFAMFIMGIFFGSFYTLAVYRIPLKQDITHTRSYCPKCNHKLNSLDLIPVFSYIFLGGKCRYCKEKIRPRYIILETLSGTAFVLFATCLKINILNIKLTQIATLIFGILLFSTICITTGIFIEHKKIEKSVFNFGIIVELIYMIYLYILNTSIYRYIIYFVGLTIIFIFNNNKKTSEIAKTIGFIALVVVGIIEIILTI